MAVPKITVAIQAGGRSSRMGRDKGLVLLGGRPMIEHVLARVEGLGDETIITTNDPDSYSYLSLPLATDAEPGAGALPGLLTALKAARGEHLLVVACDMPFLNRSLLAHLLSLRHQADVVVPLWQDRHQTMHSVYARQPVLVAVEAALAEGERRMIGFYPHLRVLTVGPETVTQFDPDGRSFFNANTPEELAEAEQIAQ